MLLFGSCRFFLVQAETEKAVMPNHAVILLYHHVATNTPAITSISPTVFEQQLQHLEDKQFTIWPLPKIIDYLKHKKTLPDKTVAITFDDNYQSVYTAAYPALKKRNWPFTIFVSTDAVDGRFNWQASWDQLRTMASNGATIANHSASHSHLLQRKKAESNTQWQQRIRTDINRAEHRIKQEIGYSHKLFAYPYGEYNAQLAALVEDLGYIGFGQQSGAIGENNYSLSAPRFAFAGKYTELDDFALKIMTLPLAIDGIKAQQNPLKHTMSQPKLTLTLKNSNLPSQSLQCFGSYQGKLQQQWQAETNNTVIISPNQDIPIGRSRYNCTLPAGQGRFYWFSHLWIRLDKNNQWLLD